MKTTIIWLLADAAAAIQSTVQASNSITDWKTWILPVTLAANHVAVTLDMSYREFWNLPAERLEAVLNADIPRTLAMFAGNTAFGTAANAALDAANYGAVRAPVELPANVTFDGKKFIVTQTTNENV